jgi:hypothetical protein
METFPITPQAHLFRAVNGHRVAELYVQQAQVIPFIRIEEAPVAPPESHFPLLQPDDRHT